MGETLALRSGDVLCSLEDGSIILRLAASKTSPSAQQSLAHFDHRLAALIRWLLSHFGPDEALWPFSGSHFRQCFASLSNFFSLERLQLVPYSIRRGGATYFYSKTDALDTVMIRGRWKDQSTARIYLDDARATLVKMAIPASSKPLVTHFRRLLLLQVCRCAKGQVNLG